MAGMSRCWKHRWGDYWRMPRSGQGQRAGWMQGIGIKCAWCHGRQWRGSESVGIYWRAGSVTVLSKLGDGQREERESQRDLLLFLVLTFEEVCQPPGHAL